MKKQKITIKKLIKVIFNTTLLILLGALHLSAQDFGSFGNLYTSKVVNIGYDELNSTGISHLDLDIPSGTAGKTLTLVAKGGDGGRATQSTKDSWGGEAATASGTFKIGTAENELKEGGKIRFIIGHKGDNGDYGAGGGGGTGILYQEPSGGNWYPLVVAGGGGGAVRGWTYTHFFGGTQKSGQKGYGGQGGRDTEYGGNGGQGGGTGGKNGLGGEQGGGGGLYAGVKRYCWSGVCANGEPAMPNASNPVGGVGGSHVIKGGFGFGGGGAGEGVDDYRHGGGGGGYSGGGRGANGGIGGGGGSYVSTKAVLSQKVAGEAGAEPSHTDRYKSENSGNVSYYFDLLPYDQNSTLVLASNPNILIYSEEGKTKNHIPFNTQAADASMDQNLIFNTDGSISIAKRPDRCLDLLNGQTDNGTAIEVIPCTGYGSQKWIYDGITQALRSKEDYSKCITAGATGDYLTLEECNNSQLQQFKPSISN